MQIYLLNVLFIYIYKTPDHLLTWYYTLPGKKVCLQGTCTVKAANFDNDS
jgi:hypothetical protein